MLDLDVKEVWRALDAAGLVNLSAELEHSAAKPASFESPVAAGEFRRCLSFGN